MTAKKSILNPAPAQNFLNDWLLKNKLMRWIWLLLFSSVVFAQRTVVGQALLVRGLNEDTPKSQIQSLQSEGRILRLNAPTARIELGGLPVWLEINAIVGSTLTPQFRQHPDGFEARLEFAKDNRTFLLVGVRSALDAIVVDKWRVGLNANATGSQMVLGTRRIELPLGGNVWLGAWCVHLLALHLPPPPNQGIASEAEQPRLDWVAWRVANVANCRS
jgi:hypothetical protein